MTRENPRNPVGFGNLQPGQRLAATRWLQLGVLALGIAGLFAILLVAARSPGMEHFFPWIDFFRTALVIHVDQSVLIWFLAMAGVLWSLLDRAAVKVSAMARLAFILALCGTLGLALSAFVGDGLPLMNNYVPVLQRPLFFAMLGLFAAGIILRLSLFLRAADWSALFSREPDLPTVAGATAAVATLVAFMALIWSWFGIPDLFQGQAYYEYLFWGAGHTLQFAYTQLLLLAWLLLAVFSGVPLPAGPRPLRLLLLLGILPVALVPLIYLAFPVVSAESRLGFTRLMVFGGGVAAIPVAALTLRGLLKAPAAQLAQRPLRMSLWMSLTLFLAGGALGISISGVNTVIPAHYHGSIVGVTLALMGFAYLLLPHLGYPPVAGRLASAQPLVYGVGQLLHIGGLALSGSMGIQRKTAGAAQGLDSLAAKAAMGVMGIGGLLAVIGGILFVWVMLRAFLHHRGR